MTAIGSARRFTGNPAKAAAELSETLIRLHENHKLRPGKVELTRVAGMLRIPKSRKTKKTRGILARRDKGIEQVPRKGKACLGGLHIKRLGRGFGKVFKNTEYSAFVNVCKT